MLELFRKLDFKDRRFNSNDNGNRNKQFLTLIFDINIDIELDFRKFAKFVSTESLCTKTPALPTKLTENS